VSSAARVREVLRRLEPQVLELRTAAAVGAPLPPDVSVELLDRMLAAFRRVRMADGSRDAVLWELAATEVEAVWVEVGRLTVEAACKAAAATAPSCNRGAL
jgi:hypothetical protein